MFIRIGKQIIEGKTDMGKSDNDHEYGEVNEIGKVKKGMGEQQSRIRMGDKVSNREFTIAESLKH